MLCKSLLSSIALLAATHVVNASPVAPVNSAIANAVLSAECLLVNVAVNSLHAYSSATPFCSSFIGIKTSTISTTITTTLPVVTATLITTTSTSSDILPVSTSTSTLVQTVTTCIPAAATTKKAKRKAPTPTTTSLSVATALPSCVAQFASAEISTACSCLAIPTPSTTLTFTVTSSPTTTLTLSTLAVTTPSASTTTVISTSTSTVQYCPTPTSCDNQGLQYAAFYNPEGNNADDSYSTFDPTYLKSTSVGGQGTANLYYSAVTTTAGGIDNHCTSADITVYGDSTEFGCQFFTLDHRGYLFAAETGTYTFSVSGVDDIFFLWTGTTAQSGWTRDNTALTVTETASDGSYSVDLTQGEYLPFRMIFGQAQGYAVFQVSVTDPNNDVILDSDSAGSPYLVQYSCDGTTAPQFAGAFGEEE